MKANETFKRGENETIYLYDNNAFNIAELNNKIYICIGRKVATEQTFKTIEEAEEIITDKKFKIYAQLISGLTLEITKNQEKWESK